MARSATLLADVQVNRLRFDVLRVWVKRDGSWVETLSHRTVLRELSPNRARLHEV